MNEQKKVTLPGSISNIPTTNYGRAYSIVSTWVHHYTPDEMKRLLIGRGVDISDIDVEAMHKVCSASLEGLTAPAGGLEITYEEGTKESRSASASLMQPKTPEEHEKAWIERKRGVEVVITPELANDPKAAKMIKLMEATGATIHVGCPETMNFDGNIAQAASQKQLSGIRMLMHNGMAGAFRGGVYDHIKTVGFPSLSFPHYTEEYVQELAIKRKAKRIKNQRRRRNAKARRK